MIHRRRLSVRPEQILVTSSGPRGFYLGGAEISRFPFEEMAGTHVYTLDEADLRDLLVAAAHDGYPILSGSFSERRGLRGFEVGIGAWGWRGKVCCRCIDNWAWQPAPALSRGVSDLSRGDRVATAERDLRALCRRLNDEETPFSPSSGSYLSSLYRRLAAPLEPNGVPDPLPEDVAILCRRAHSGGPIVHVQSSLSPWVSLDRRRAYGEAMLGDLPVGLPAEVALPQSGSTLGRWRSRDLQSACGIADATVLVFPGPLVPLLPLLERDGVADGTKTTHPTGTFRGAFVLDELQFLERTDRGRVLNLHRVVTFDSRPIYAPLIRYLRKLEPDLPFVKMKTLEHVLYGKNARGLYLERIGTGPGWRCAYVRDLLDDRSHLRVRGRPDLQPEKIVGTGGGPHRVSRLRVRLGPSTERGALDRPDRAAFVTSRNRVAIAEIISTLDEALGSSRSGSCVGRVYVDGLDVQARPDQIPAIPGVVVTDHGPNLLLWRSAGFVREHRDGSTTVEGSGQVMAGGKIGAATLLSRLSEASDSEQGWAPLGRIWPDAQGDARMIPGMVSEPIHMG